MSNTAENRASRVEETLARVKSALEKGVTREQLAVARDILAALAADTELWNEAEFPEPTPPQQQARYLIGQDDPAGLSLYLNVMLPGKKIPPHNHTTWACVAAVKGTEHNFLYERTDDGSVPGRADVRQTGLVEVAPGTPIALMPDDIHHVEIRGTDTIRHLHMYGRPLETLTERITFDPETGTCRTMDIGVKTRAADAAAKS